MTDLKETLKDQVIDPLERPELYDEYDLGVVNGVLLYGPPGTGKTYITEALAGELDYNYIEAQASDITSSLVGEAAENMSEMFEVARDNQPCLLFMDEIEAIAAERSGGSQKTMSESQMITQFLTEMSETKGEDVVVVSATTSLMRSMARHGVDSTSGLRYLRQMRPPVARSFEFTSANVPS